MTPLVSLGADPEFVVVGPDGPEPAHRWYPHKHSALQFAGGSVYRDGYAVELNFAAPTPDPAVLMHWMASLFASAEAQLPVTHHLEARPSWFTQPADFEAAPPDVLEFGCEPTLNAYTGKTLRPPAEAARTYLRSGGGHGHFGVVGLMPEGGGEPVWNVGPWFASAESRFLWVRLMDYYAGVPLGVLLNTPLETARRRLYGRAGELRLQHYGSYFEGTDRYVMAGLEYRVMSNRVYSNEALGTLFLRIGQHLMANFETYAASWHPELEVEVCSALNTGRGYMQLLLGHPGLEGIYSPGNILEWYEQRFLFTAFTLPYTGGN